MELSITPRKDLEALVEASVERTVTRTLEKFYREQTEKETEPKNLSVKETAQFLSVSELTVRNYIKRGYISAEHIGHRIFINRQCLHNALREVKSFKYKR